MTKKIVEYKLHRIADGKLVTPGFISDGGYFSNGEKLIGIVDTSLGFYIPQTTKDNANAELVEYTRAELIALIQGTGFKDADMVDMSAEDIAIMVNAWCDARSIAA